MIESLKIDFTISGTKIFLPFKAICSVTDKEFGGEVVIEYVPRQLVLEYVDAERFVNEVCKKNITAEELANTVFNAVDESIKPSYLKVLVDVVDSKAHQPVKVWREGNYSLV